MMQPNSQMHDFVERLIAHETRGSKSSTTNSQAAFPVIAKLRPTLTNLMGSAGFSALLSRALVLASKNVRWLEKLQVKSDGYLQGLDELAKQIDPDEFLKGQVALLAQLFGLLVAFIGEKLTLNLVLGVWPKLSLNDLDFSK